MKIRFEEKTNNRYMMVYPEKSEEIFSSFLYRMILENRIKGLLPCRIGNMDGRTIIYYNVTGLIRVNEYLREHAADEAFFKRFLRELAAAAEELQRYLIGSESILLDPEQVFVSSDTECFRFAVWFEERKPFSENLLKLSEYLIPRLPNNNHAAAAIGYELYQRCLSGLVTADTLRLIADTDGKSGTAVSWPAEEETKEESILSEDDIFVPAKKRRKWQKGGRTESWTEKIAKTVIALKEKIAAFFHSFFEE